MASFKGVLLFNFSGELWILSLKNDNVRKRKISFSDFSNRELRIFAFFFYF